MSENNLVSHYSGVCLLDQPFLSSVLCFSHCLTQKPLEHGLNYKPGAELQTVDDLVAPSTFGNLRFAAASRHHMRVLAKNQHPPTLLSGGTHQTSTHQLAPTYSSQWWKKSWLLFYDFTMNCKVETPIHIKCEHKVTSLNWGRAPQVPMW